MKKKRIHIRWIDIDEVKFFGPWSGEQYQHTSEAHDLNRGLLAHHPLFLSL